MNAVVKKQESNFGLGELGDISSLLDAPQNNGGPLELPLNLIDEDPEQPRTEFDPVKLDELANTIRLRGIKTPISVRSNPNAPGRYIINHGARRCRASKIAGKDTVPGFVDEDYNNIDQAIENLHRDGLTPREIANLIDKELSKGRLKGEIAEALGKSPAFVKQHVTLLDLPEPIAVAFNSNRCRDVTVINELVTAYKKNPQDVSDFLDNKSQEITRGSVKLLRDFIEDRHGDDEPGQHPGEQTDTGSAAGKKDKSKIPPDPDKIKKSIVMVQYDGRPARLILNKRPTAEGYGWVKYEIDGLEEEVELDQVQIIAVMEG